MVSVGMKCVKYLLFLFNLAIFVAGLVLIGVGAVVQTAYNDYFAFFGGQLNSAAIFLVIIGVILFVVGFFGCCGAYKENHCMIITFAVILTVIFVLEISAAIAAFVMRSEIDKVVREKMITSSHNYEKKGVKIAWDEVQRTLHCCGSTNYTDWSENTFLNETYSVPESCCIDSKNATCGKDVLKTHHTDHIYTTGCTDKLIHWVLHNILIIAGVALGFAFLQLFGVCLSCCLADSIRKEYTAV